MRDSAWLSLPLGLAAPEPADAQRILAALPGARQPAWWSAPSVHLKDATVVLSLAAVSLNTQAVRLLDGAHKAADLPANRALVIIAPLFAHEGFATLLVNDAMRALPGGLVLLRSRVPQEQVEETIARLGELLCIPPWDGRVGHLRAVRVARIAATHADVRLRLRSPTSRIAALIPQAVRSFAFKA